MQSLSLQDHAVRGKWRGCPECLGFLELRHVDKRAVTVEKPALVGQPLFDSLLFGVQDPETLRL